MRERFATWLDLHGVPDRCLKLFGLESRDAAWADGYSTAHDEAEEGKDSFIAEQSALISALIETEAIDWSKVPPDMKHRLADYV